MHEPKTVPDGSEDDGEYELAHGVVGYAVEANGKIYIPAFRALKEGNGDVGRFLDSLSPRCVIPTVISRRLLGMLTRRGWVKTIEVSEALGEPFDVWTKAHGGVDGHTDGN